MISDSEYSLVCAQSAPRVCPVCSVLHFDRVVVIWSNCFASNGVGMSENGDGLSGLTQSTRYFKKGVKRGKNAILIFY